jgi:transposase InsO family protein
VKRLCAAAGVSRTSYYRSQVRRVPSAESMVLRDALQKIALQFPAYGYRRITPELRRHGHAVNHKRVLRWMRADNLLCLRRKSFVRTTDSEHGWPVYPNLAAKLEVTGRNQLWVADLTYIRLLREFAYLAVVLDAWSRRVVGWALGETLEAELTLTALRSDWRTAPAARAGASFRPRGAICLWRVSALSRRSGCVPAEPYPPLSSVQSGATQLRRTMIFHRTALTPFTPCLTQGVHCILLPLPDEP